MAMIDMFNTYLVAAMHKHQWLISQLLCWQGIVYYFEGASVVDVEYCTTHAKLHVGELIFSPQCAIL